MVIRRSMLTICLVGGLALPASAQVKLERKFREGSTYTVEVKTKLDQKLSIAGMDTETSSETTTVVKGTVGKRDDAGQLRVQDKVESLKIMMSVMGQEYQFDSASPDNAGSSAYEMLRPVHKAMTGRTTTIVYDKNNKVAMIELDQNVLGNLSEDVRNLVKSQFDPEKLKETATQEDARLPSDPIKKGDTWDRTEKMNLGAGQVMTVTTQYTYEGEVDRNGKKVDKIASKVTTIDFTIEPGSPLPLTVKASALKPAESKGEIYFDRALGAGIATVSLVRIVGDITFVINNMELPSKLDLKIESATQSKQ